MKRSRPRYSFPLQRRTALGFFAGTALLAGCSAQATTDYEGESMFSMAGRVELALEASGDLIPTLAFMAPGGDEVQFVQAEVSGEFPASFQLDLYEPPPAAVVDGFEYEDHPGEPRYSIGYVAAVTPDHLSTLYMASGVSGAADAEESCDDAGCLATLEATSFDATHVGTIRTYCPHESSSLITPPFLCEARGRTGDPMLISTVMDPMFAGAADNYAVAYLEGAAPAGGFVARRLGAPEGLAAGYHLLRTMPWITWPETADSPHVQAELAKQPCRDEAKQLAAERYNAAHGTEVGSSDIQIMGCNEPGCEMYGPHTRGVRGEWYRAMVEMDCFFGPEYTPETDPDAVVSLTIQPGLSFMMAASGVH